MTSYEFGDVVLVHFPQSGTTTRNQRPGIVVLDVGDADIVIAPVTSKPRFQAGDLALTTLSGTGLIRPSWVRLAKVATLLKAGLVRTLGRLSEGVLGRPTAGRPRLANVVHQLCLVVAYYVVAQMHDFASLDKSRET